MADTPWRCSQCRTINEPVANSCRTCGRWPSLFDLQDSRVEEAPVAATATARSPDVGTFEPQAYEPETFRPEPVEPETFDVEAMPEEAATTETVRERRRRVVTSLLVPLAFVVYIVISIIFGDRGSS
jgi:hypothetical protein